MSIKDLLKEDKLAVEEALDGFVPEVDTLYSTVNDAMRYSLMLGGKRIRPCLTLEFCKACGGRTESALSLAAAVEMIHTYSLIHDDLPCMDNDDMRRGQPSCHKKYGYAEAMLAGDALLTAAFRVAVSDSALPAERRVEAVELLSSLAGINGMVGGQVMDLRFEGQSPSAELLGEINSLKTGALLRAAAELGCIAAEADEGKRAAARSYAEYLGEAFQITDDILDIIGDGSKLGKPIGSDAENRKQTYAALNGIEAARSRAAELTEAAVGALEVFGDRAESLKELAFYLLERDH